MTKVTDVMTRDVRVMSPSDTLQSAAQAMDELNVGAIPVCEGGQIVGLVTDRDIVVRAIAQGLPVQQTPLRDVMSAPVRCCHEHDSLGDVAELMGSVQLRRVPVLDLQQRLVGMLSLGDIAAKAGPQHAGGALSDISEPAEPDRSTRRADSVPAAG